MVAIAAWIKLWSNYQECGLSLETKVLAVLNPDEVDETKLSGITK
jgi:hypothetical protein